MAFDHSSFRWFEISSCKPTPRGPPSSSTQLRGARCNPHFLTGCPFAIIIFFRILKAIHVPNYYLHTHPDHRFQPNSHLAMETEVDVDNKKRYIIGQILVFGTLALIFGAILEYGTVKGVFILGLLLFFACMIVISIGRFIFEVFKKKSEG